MAKQHKTVHEYNVSAETLYKSFKNAELIQQKYEHIGARNVSVTECTDTSVKTSREVTADVPKVLAKFAKEWNELKQFETWSKTSNGYAADLTIKLAGVPVDITGTLTIESTGDNQCNNTVEIHVKCGIPLIGGKAEAFVLEDTKKQIQEEYVFLKETVK